MHTFNWYYKYLFKTLFQFRDDVEDSAHIIQSKSHQTNKPYNAINNKFHSSRIVFPSRTMQQLSTQTWYTPSKKEYIFIAKSSAVGNWFRYPNRRRYSQFSSEFVDDDSEFTVKDSFDLIKAGNRRYYFGLKKRFCRHLLEWLLFLFALLLLLLVYYLLLLVL